MAEMTEEAHTSDTWEYPEPKDKAQTKHHSDHIN